MTRCQIVSVGPGIGVQGLPWRLPIRGILVVRWALDDLAHHPSDLEEDHGRAAILMGADEAAETGELQ